LPPITRRLRVWNPEIAFGRPRDRLPSVDDAVFDEMGRLLNLGLAAVRTNGEESVPIEGLDDNQTAQLFEAIRALTPPMRGGVKRIELGGELTGQVTTSRVLTRDDRLRAVERIKAWKKVPAKGVLFRVTGVAEGLTRGWISSCSESWNRATSRESGPLMRLSFSSTIIFTTKYRMRGTRKSGLRLSESEWGMIARFSTYRR
jgi:hypothetical protein